MVVPENLELVVRLIKPREAAVQEEAEEAVAQ
jgi:hypothetical protein